jgi:hypothetical protein
MAEITVPITVTTEDETGEVLVLVIEELERRGFRIRYPILVEHDDDQTKKRP